MNYKSQAVQDVSIRIHSIKEDGTDNTGDAANLSTIILDPAGNEIEGITDYTEATFKEIGTSGVYECLFLTAAITPVFTSIDQDNPYTVILISSTASIGASQKTIKIVSKFIGELALEATLDEIKGVGWTIETLKEIFALCATRLASTPFASEHPPTTAGVTDGTVLSGGVAQIQTINQEYLKVQETGKFKIDSGFTLIDEEHDKFYLTYRYFGAGSSNHKIKLKIWNYTTPGWDDVTAEQRDLPATDIDTTLIFAIPGNVSDYYAGSIPNLTAELRIEHESNNNDDHNFWLDAIGFGDLEIIYTAPDNAGILANGEAIDLLPTLGEMTGEIQNGTFTRIAVTGDAIQIIEENFKTIQIDLGTEWDLTDKLVYFVMARQNSSDAPIVNRLVDRITDAINGIAEIDLLTTETTPKGCYDYQVELRNDPADDKPETAMEGTAEITENLRS